MVVDLQPIIYLLKPVGVFVFIGLCFSPAWSQVHLGWEHDQAAYFTFPTSLLPGEPSIEVHKKGSKSAILGKIQKIQDSIVFRPALRFEKGMEYEVYSAGNKLTHFKVPKNSHTSTYVQSVFPSVDTLPQNLLKVYIVFSSPMAENQAYDHLQLTDELGNKIPEAFLTLTPELWDEERKTFTLWFDPGRVKKHLLRHQKLGAPLEQGKNYSFVISRQWTDREGNPLKESFKKTFFVQVADTRSPDLAAWEIKVPKAGTDHKLIVSLKESLDYSLILGNMVGLSRDEQAIHGRFALVEGEKILEFTPQKPWTPGRYQLTAYHALEDLAGNNLNRLFDRDLKKETRPGTKKYHTRYFDRR